MVILGLIAFCAGERTVPAVLIALIIIGYEPVGVFFGVIVCVLLGHFSAALLSGCRCIQFINNLHQIHLNISKFDKYKLFLHSVPGYPGTLCIWFRERIIQLLPILPYSCGLCC